MPNLPSRLKTLLRKKSQFFRPPNSSPSPPPTTQTRRPRSPIHINFTKHLTAHIYTVEETIHAHNCSTLSCGGFITITQISDTRCIATPTAIKLCQVVPQSSSNILSDKGVVIATTIELQSTPFMKEVALYGELLQDEEYSMIGGNYDRNGREVLVEDETQEVCCMRCGGLWLFRLKAVKVKGEVGVVLDCE